MTTSRLSYDFVNDLIPIILESNDHWWPQDLLRLARVSSAWLSYVRKRLYACPAINTFHTCSLLTRTLMENPSLIPLIRGIDLKPMVVDTYEEKPLSPKERSSLRFILGLEVLQSITFGGHLSVRAERFLNFLANPDSVKELHIDGSLLSNALSFRPSLEWSEELAFRLSNLRILQLTRVELDILPPSIPYTLPISDLVLNHVDITSGYLSHLLHGIDSLDRLSVSAKTANDFDEHVRLMLSSCEIRTLQYEVQGDVPSERSIFDIDSLNNSSSLRCLHLKGHHVDSDTLQSIQQHCQHLEELIVAGRMVRVSPKDWAAFIRSGALASLQYLAVSWGTNGPPFKAWSPATAHPILEATASRKIQLAPC